MAEAPADMAAPGDAGADAASPADMAGYPAWDPRSPAICGAAPYTWIPRTSVGTLLESQTRQNLSAIEVQALTTAGYLTKKLNVKRRPVHDVRLVVIRYQTQDRGAAVDATAMLAFPMVGSPRPFPVALFLHPTMGYTDGCAPSRKAGDVTAPMTLFALLTASYGYIAVFPDYLDQKSLGAASRGVTPYLLMEPTAIAALDAVRAAFSYAREKEPNARPTNDVYIWGHSQGAQAAQFVVAFERYYASELNIKAAAAAAPPSDLVAAARLNFASPFRDYRLGRAIAYAWRSYYGGTPLTSALKPPWDGTSRAELEQFCTPGHKDPINDIASATDAFTTGFIDTLTRPGTTYSPWSCWLHYNNPATMGPKLDKAVPMLLITGDADTIVFPPASLATFNRWCAEGISIQHLRCEGADHVGALINSIDDVFDFFDDRRSGAPLPATVCKPASSTRCRSTP